MPTYEFNCDKCGNAFSLILSIREYEKERERFRCPKCKSKKLNQQISTFAVNSPTTHALAMKAAKSRDKKLGSELNRADSEYRAKQRHD